MFTLKKEELKKELDFYFKQKGKKPLLNKLEVYGKDSEQVLKICKNNKRYGATFDKDGEEASLNDALVQENNEEFILLYKTLKTHNDKIRQRKQRLASIFLPGVAGVGTALLVGLGLAAGLSLAAISLNVLSIPLIVGGSIVAALTTMFAAHQILKPNSMQPLNPDSVEAIEGSTIDKYKKSPKTTWEIIKSPFTLANQGLKWVARKLILDNFASYLIGVIIAKFADDGNPHYKTKPQTVAKTLGPLIFQAGLSEGQIDKGRMDLGPTLSKQWESIRQFREQFTWDANTNEYVFNKNESIKFKKTGVLVNKNTLVAGLQGSNGLVKDNEDITLYKIYFNGNSSTYHEDTASIANDLLEYEKDGKPVTAIQFNYPNVVNSTGKVNKAADLIEAGIAQVKNLLDKGVKAENIALTGDSLGGSISTHVMNYFYQRGIILHGLYVRNTFSSTTNVGLSYVRKSLHKIADKTQKIPGAKKFLKFFIVNPVLLLLRPVLDFGLWGAEWQLNTAPHFISVPEKLRNYSLVRSESNIRKRYHPKDDPVIDHYASLHEAWSLRLFRFFHKYGLVNHDANTYDQTRRSHKTSVFERDNLNEKPVFKPEVCGHSEVPNNYSGIGKMLRHRGKTDNCEDGIVGSFTAIPDKGYAETTTELGFESGAKMREFFLKPEERFTNDSIQEKVVRSIVACAA